MGSVDGKQREALLDEIPAAGGGEDAVGEKYQPTFPRTGARSQHDVHLEAFRRGERPGPAEPGTASQNRWAGRRDRPTGDGAGFFRECLAADQGDSPAERRRWREHIYAEIRSRVRTQGGLTIQRMCELAGVSRASFYRSWEQQEPTAAEMAVGDAIQRTALERRYIRLPQNRGAPAAASSVPSSPQPGPTPRSDGHQSALGGGPHLLAARSGVCLSGCRAGCLLAPSDRMDRRSSLKNRMNPTARGCRRP